METQEIWGSLSLGLILMGKKISLIDRIVKWISDYAIENSISSLVIGVSGGIDSAVTSTLCAKTGINTIVLNMPIHQAESQRNLSKMHIDWLISNFDNVIGKEFDLTQTFDTFIDTDLGGEKITNLARANSRARIRMAALYAISASNNGIVVGTGNKVEDFGVGFYTKYGDGGVDISPIADLYKTEIYLISESLGIIEEIRDAPPTDGLWDDGRTDEDQIGASYEELEWAMEQPESISEDLNDRQKEVMKIYLKFRNSNLHKMEEIPVFDAELID